MIFSRYLINILWYEPEDEYDMMLKVLYIICIIPVFVMDILLLPIELIVMLIWRRRYK